LREERGEGEGKCDVPRGRMSSRRHQGLQASQGGGTKSSLEAWGVVPRSGAVEWARKGTGIGGCFIGGVNFLSGKIGKPQRRATRAGA